MKTTSTPPQAIILAFVLAAYLLAIGIIVVIAFLGTKIPNYVNLDVLSSIITTVGGAISALVGAELTTANPTTKESGSISRNVAPELDDERRTQIVFWFFIVWCVVGFISLVAGLVTADATGILLPIGTAWLGVAVTSITAYYRINPNQNSSESQPTTTTPAPAGD